mmetsp:Transcript_43122/g.113273  ORF Transcript_43122/g.113273 Transcript_43122/m.113273 type:complete len:297 (+) Transcript_43122:189-1079(+)
MSSTRHHNSSLLLLRIPRHLPLRVCNLVWQQLNHLAARLRLLLHAMALRVALDVCVDRLVGRKRRGHAFDRGQLALRSCQMESACQVSPLLLGLDLGGGHAVDIEPRQEGLARLCDRLDFQCELAQLFDRRFRRRAELRALDLERLGRHRREVEEPLAHQLDVGLLVEHLERWLQQRDPSLVHRVPACEIWLPKRELRVQVDLAFDHLEVTRDEAVDHERGLRACRVTRTQLEDFSCRLEGRHLLGMSAQGGGRGEGECIKAQAAVRPQISPLLFGGLVVGVCPARGAPSQLPRTL